jgi:hypothetical protein
MGDISAMSSDPPGDGDFTFEETQALEYDDVFRAKTGPGKRNVSMAARNGLWNAPSSSSSSAAPGVTVRRIGYDRRHQRQGSFEMPTTAISAEALEYICFLPTTAKFIFHQYQKRPNPDTNPDTLMDYVVCHVEQITSIQDGGHTRDQAMIQVGLNEDFRERMQDPRYEAIFMTKPLLYWVLHDLETSDGWLKGIHKRLKHRAREIIAMRPN